MKLIYKAILALTVLLAFNLPSKASHFAGGDIQIQCLGGNQYVIRLNFFRDCTGIAAPGAAEINNTFDITSSCGDAISTGFSFELENPGGTEISQLCATELNNSTCSGGTLYGMQRYTYVDTIVLPTTCQTGTWSFGYSSGSRNEDIVNVLNSSSENWYIEASINLGNDPCNNTPFFTGRPIPYVCANQLINYSFGVIETDGDSIVYSLVASQSAPGNTLDYAVGYTATEPIPGIYVSPTTGQITFTSPSTQGIYIVVLQAQEYDRVTDQLISTTMRDIQFVTIPCSNTPPNINTGTISSFTAIEGTPTQTSSFTISGCEGDKFTWRTTYTDPNSTDSLSISHNGNFVFPGLTYTSTYTGTTGYDTLTVTWTLTIPSGAAGLNGATRSFSVEVSDNACPVPGMQTFTYNILALPSTYAGPDWIICGNQTATPVAYGGSTFTWYDLSNTIVPVNATTFTCNPCANPIIKPGAVGTYTFVVQSNLLGGCKNRDTIKVIVTNNFLPTLAQTDSVCLGVPVILDVTPVSTATLSYTYSWSPVTGLNNPTIANPTATFLTGGIYTYVVSITSNEGCVKTDTSTITVSSNRDPLFAEIIQEIPICLGGTANLNIDFGVGDPSTCGLSTTGICSSITTYNTGTSSGNSTGTDDSPFKGFWEDGRHQSLFLASELTTQGIGAGKIGGLKLNVTTKASTQPYNNFTIKMGCTNITALTSTFQTGLTQVFTSNHTTVAGINAFSFAVPYEWDGVSNLLIEICFDNDDWTSNDAVSVQNTTYASSTTDNTDGAVGCSLAASPITINKRPVFTFDWCSATPNPNSFIYAWTPATGLSATNIHNPSAVPPTDPYTYSVYVEDKIGGCNVTATKAISFTVPYDPAFSYSSNIFCKNTTNPTPTLVSTASIPVSRFSATPPGLFFTNVNTGTINLGASAANTYTVTNTITYTSGSCPPSIATYTVVISPSDNASFTYVSNYYCQGNSTIETPVKASPSTSGTFTYTANPGTSSLICNPTTGAIDIDGSTPGTFTVLYTTNGTCASTFTRSFVIGPGPTTSFTYAANPYCKNGSNPTVTLNPGSFAGSYTVTSSNASSLTFVNASTGEVNIASTATGSYTIRNTYTSAPSTGCPTSFYESALVISPVDISTFNYSQLNYCKGASPVTPALMPISPGSFTATPAGLFIHATTGEVNLNTSSAGTYTIRFTTTGICTSTTTQQFIIRNNPSSTISYNPQFACEGSGALIPVTLGPGVVATGTFAFPTDLTQLPTTPGTVNVNLSMPSNEGYIVTYTVSNGFCATSDTALFFVRPKDDASFSYSSTSFCKTGTNPTPTITGVAGGSFSSSNLSVLSDGTINLSASTVGGPYSIVYTTPMGGGKCPNSSTVNVTITDGQYAGFLYDNIYCKNTQDIVTPTLETGSSAGTYSASPAGIVFENESTGAIKLKESTPGVYTITHTVAATETCAAASATQTVTIIGTEASFTATPITGVKPLNVTFNNTSTGALSYMWNFGNGNTDSIQNPSYTYSEPGVFIVVLTSDAGNNCTDTASISINVDNTSVLEMPNTFSPDNDGLNDIFIAKSYQAIADFECQIYNRWGKKVYEWNDVSIGWNGDGYPDGVYYYVIKAKGIDNQPQDKNGTVTLFRK